VFREPRALELGLALRGNQHRAGPLHKDLEGGRRVPLLDVPGFLRAHLQCGLEQHRPLRGLASELLEQMVEDLGHERGPSAADVHGTLAVTLGAAVLIL
jgi:hypothetical protein